LIVDLKRAAGSRAGPDSSRTAGRQRLLAKNFRPAADRIRLGRNGRPSSASIRR